MSITNINDHNVAGYQSRNKKGNVETGRTDLNKFAFIPVKTEKYGYSPLSGDSTAEMGMMEDNHLNNNNGASDWIYQHGSLSNPFKNVRFAEGESSRKRFKKQ